MHIFLKSVSNSNVTLARQIRYITHLEANNRQRQEPPAQSTLSTEWEYALFIFLFLFTNKAVSAIVSKKPTSSPTAKTNKRC